MTISPVIVQNSMPSNISKTTVYLENVYLNNLVSEAKVKLSHLCTIIFESAYITV